MKFARLPLIVMSGLLTLATGPGPKAQENPSTTPQPEPPAVASGEDGGALDPARSQVSDTVADETVAPVDASNASDADEMVAPVDANEIDALIRRVEEQIERMNQASEQRDEALKFLEEQIDKATSQISTKEQTESALRQRAIELDSEIEKLSEDREALSSEVETREQTLSRLESQVAELESLLAVTRSEGENRVAELRSRLTSQQERDAARIADLESQLALEREEADARTAELEGLITEERARAEAATAAMGDLETAHAREIEGLEDRIEDERLRAKAVAEAMMELKSQQLQQVTALENEIEALDRSASSARDEVAASEARIEALTRQVGELVEQLSFVQTALSASEAKIGDQGDRIRVLNAQLTEALRAEVEELERYRSDFFGELRKILGDSEDLDIVGDRFVLPSNLFFALGSARLSPEAQGQLSEIASTLKQISSRIPREIDWILRVDGHTDDTPLIEGSFYESNWELSSARAIAVVKYLIEAGIDPKRLAATGFGEFQPLDPFDRDRNRRIEFKLTEG
jgi:chemotaxis protein MotB